MPNEFQRPDESSLSSMTITGDSSSTQPSLSSAVGSSRGCWAANLSASIGLGFTIWKLGIPLAATCVEALRAKDLTTFAMAFGAVLMIARASGPNDFVKLITAVKDLPASWKK
jgi:hypothetical protein